MKAAVKASPEARPLDPLQNGTTCTSGAAGSCLQNFNDREKDKRQRLGIIAFRRDLFS